MIASWLRWLARYDTTILVAGVVVAILLPQLASTFRPLVEPLVVLIMTVSLVRLDTRALAAYGRRPSLALLTVLWMLIVSPLVVWGLLAGAAAAGLALPAVLVAAMVVNASAPPITASVPFAQLLRLDVEMAVFVVVATFLAVPLTLGPILLWLLEIELEVGLLAFYQRVAVFVFSPFVLAFILRRFIDRERLKAVGREFDGAMVVIMLVFAIGIMEGLGDRVYTQPAMTALYAGTAFALNLLLNLMGVAGFWWLGRKAAFSMGVVSGSRNLAVMLAIMGGMIGPEFPFYVALAQLPIYLMPAIGLPVYRRLTATTKGEAE